MTCLHEEAEDLAGDVEQLLGDPAFQEPRGVDVHQVPVAEGYNAQGLGKVLTVKSLTWHVLRWLMIEVIGMAISLL